MLSQGTLLGSLLLDAETIEYWGKSHLQCAPQSALGSLGPRNPRLKSRECRVVNMLDYPTNGPEVITVRKSTTNNRMFFIKECFQFNMMHFLHKSLGETI